MKTMRIALFLIPGALALAAGPFTETHSYDLAAGGAIELKNAAGDLAIDAWDQPRVELTVIKSSPDPKLLEKVKVTAEASASALTISSSYPKYSRLERPFRWTLNFDLAYRIRAPKTARLKIDAYAGQINVSGIAGDIRASDSNGDIFLLLPDGRYTIRARTKIGRIVSDFPGSERRNPLLFGHAFISSAESGSKLDLNTRTGTITILRIRKPPLAD